MEIWTYAKAKTKVITDDDLFDETFISPNELAGYFNEGLTEAKAEICTIYEDYFLTQYYLPLVQGISKYKLPYNILANKIRHIMYSNGSIIYPITKYKRLNKFEGIAFTQTYGIAEDYRYILTNDVIGQARLQLYPTSRDTAVLAPLASLFVPAVMWYIRDCAKVPLIAVNDQPAEFCNPEVLYPTSVNVGADTITTLAGQLVEPGIVQQGVAGPYPGSIAYVTGDAVKLEASSGGTLPASLVEGTVYYVIQTGSGVIKLATTLANAMTGTAINLTSVGTIYFLLRVAATQNIVNATLIDIPEFTEFVIQWAKCRVMIKEKDPGADAETQILVDLKKQMIDTLTNGIPDDEDEICRDFSHYTEMS